MITGINTEFIFKVETVQKHLSNYQLINKDSAPMSYLH